MRGNLRDDFAVIFHDEQAADGDFADDGGIEAPLFEDVEDFVFAALFGNEKHALLGFTEHDFVGAHAGFALGNLGEIDFDAGAATGGHFAGGASEAGGAHVLDCDDGAGLHGLETGFKKKFLGEGIADLNVGTLLLGFFGEFGGGEERGTVDAVAPGFRADVDDGIAEAFGFGEEDVFFAGDPQGKRVD